MHLDTTNPRQGRIHRSRKSLNLAQSIDGIDQFGDPADARESEERSSHCRMLHLFRGVLATFGKRRQKLDVRFDWPSKWRRFPWYVVKLQLGVPLCRGATASPTNPMLWRMTQEFRVATHQVLTGFPTASLQTREPLRETGVMNSILMVGFVIAMTLLAKSLLLDNDDPKLQLQYEPVRPAR